MGVSIPNIAFVEGDPVTLENFTNLFLVAKFLMMLCLVNDIGRDRTLDSLTEKAPYPFCQPNPWSPFSLRRFDEASLSRPIKSEKAILFDNEEKT
jgi:hypothetical protein